MSCFTRYCITRLPARIRNCVTCSKQAAESTDAISCEYVTICHRLTTDHGESGGTFALHHSPLTTASETPPSASPLRTDTFLHDHESLIQQHHYTYLGLNPSQWQTTHAPRPQAALKPQTRPPSTTHPSAPQLLKASPLPPTPGLPYPPTRPKPSSSQTPNSAASNKTSSP